MLSDFHLHCNRKASLTARGQESNYQTTRWWKHPAKYFTVAKDKTNSQDCSS